MSVNMEVSKSKQQHFEEATFEFAESNSEVEPIDGYEPDTEEERKLVRKIDLYILPTMWLMYLLSYMDRTK